MKRTLLDEGTAKKFFDMLTERFGEPIGKVADMGPGVSDERGGNKSRPSKKTGEIDEDVTPGEVNAPTCEGCGAMMPMENDTCNQCGMMASGLDEGNISYASGTGPVDVNKTWTDDDGQVRGYCNLCGGKGKIASVKQHKTVMMTCTLCKGAKIVNKTSRKVDESENGGRHPGHAKSCTCPDCSRPGREEVRSR